MDFAFTLELNEIPVNLFLSLLRSLWQSHPAVYNLFLQFAKICELVVSALILPVVLVSNKDIKEC